MAKLVLCCTFFTSILFFYHNLFLCRLIQWNNLHSLHKKKFTSEWFFKRWAVTAMQRRCIVFFSCKIIVYTFCSRWVLTKFLLLDFLLSATTTFYKSKTATERQSIKFSLLMSFLIQKRSGRYSCR